MAAWGHRGDHSPADVKLKLRECSARGKGSCTKLWGFVVPFVFGLLCPRVGCVVACSLGS